VFFFSGFEKNLICIYFFQSNSYTEQYNNKYQLTTTMPRTKASRAETDSAAIDKKQKNGNAKAPRKPRSPTAYNIFVKKFYEDFKAEDNEKLAPKEMISAAAAAWKALSDKQKEDFKTENMPVKEDKADKSDTEPDKTAVDDKPKKSSKDKTKSDNTDSAEKPDSKPKKDRKSRKDSIVEVVAKIADSDTEEATPAAAVEPVKKEKSSRKSKKSDKSSDNE
jgi:HMG-box domain